MSSIYIEMERFKRKLIIGALKCHAGNVRATARFLNMRRNTLIRWIDDLGIDLSEIRHPEHWIHNSLLGKSRDC